MSPISGLEVTEYEPTAPMVDLDTKPVLGPPARVQLRKALWLEQLDRIEEKLDILIKALAEDEEPEGTLDDPVGPLASNKLQGL